MQANGSSVARSHMGHGIVVRYCGVKLMTTKRQPLLLLCLCIASADNPQLAAAPAEMQVTFAAHGHILANFGVWSPDSRWIVYDVRSDVAGDVFDGVRIERVNIETGVVQVLYESANRSNCGVVTTSPTDGRVVFIHGPENPDENWQYAAFHRRGVVVHSDTPGKAENLDARDLTAPFTVGALRGGTHLHTFSGDGKWVAFTYEDHVLQSRNAETIPAHCDVNQRNIGVSVPLRAVTVPRSHPRNHNGTHFSMLVTRTVNRPRPGTDDISRAFSDAWVGTDGYERADESRQEKAIAFQGHVRTESGDTISEVFVVDLPDNETQPSETGPLQGTKYQRPQPPKGTTQRRLTYTDDRKYPGIQGVRHWLRSSPDGSKIAFLMRSDSGIFTALDNFSQWRSARTADQQSLFDRLGVHLEPRWKDDRPRDGWFGVRDSCRLR